MQYKMLMAPMHFNATHYNKSEREWSRASVQTLQEPGVKQGVAQLQGNTADRKSDSTILQVR